MSYLEKILDGETVEWKLLDEYADYEHGKRKVLEAAFPEFQALIAALTPDDEKDT